MTMNYDSIIITLILVVDTAVLYLLWKDQTRKARARSYRKFNKILQSVGLK